MKETLTIYGGLGDVNFLDHDGGFVARDESDPDNRPFIEYVYVPDDDTDLDCPDCRGNPEGQCRDEGCELEECDQRGDFLCVHCRGTGKNPEARWTVYRCDVGPDECDFCDLDAVETTCGYDDPSCEIETSLEEDLASCDVMRMAYAVETCAHYYGWDNFDSYPLKLSYDELQERYDGIEIPSLGRDAREPVYWPEAPAQLSLAARRKARKKARA